MISLMTYQFWAGPSEPGEHRMGSNDPPPRFWVESESRFFPSIGLGLLLALPIFQTYQRPCNKYPDHVCGAILLCRSTQFSNFLHLRSAPYVNLPQEQMKCTKETCHNNLGMPEVGRGQGGHGSPDFCRSASHSPPGWTNYPRHIIIRSS